MKVDSLIDDKEFMNLENYSIISLYDHIWNCAFKSATIMTVVSAIFCGVFFSIMPQYKSMPTVLIIVIMSVTLFSYGVSFKMLLKRTKKIETSKEFQQKVKELKSYMQNMIIKQHLLNQWNFYIENSDNKSVKERRLEMSQMIGDIEKEKITWDDYIKFFTLIRTMKRFTQENPEKVSQNISINDTQDLSKYF